MAKIGIIGGGPAGIALAYDLSEAGHAVTVFEAAPELGGLARSFAFGDLRAERYYHFICKGDAEYFAWLDRLGIAGNLRWTPATTGFFYGDRLHPFTSAGDLLRCSALTSPGRLRYGAFGLRCALAHDWRRLDGIPAKDWLVHNLGLDTYHVMWHPLLAVKFHEHHDKISAAWVWHRIHRVATSRDHLLGEQIFGHLEGGTDVLLEALIAGARARGARLVCDARVRRIVHDGRRATGVMTERGEHHAFDAIVSTAPLPVFLDMTPELPARFRSRLEAIDYLGVVCVLLRLRGSISENFWLNVNDPRVPFNGCIEYTRLNPGGTPDGTHLVYVPYYVPTHDPRFTRSDELNVEDTLAALDVLNPRFSRDWVVDATVARDRFAQVICKTGFGMMVPPHQTPIENLYLLESSQLYPADRSIGATLELVGKVSAILRSAWR